MSDLSPTVLVMMLRDDEELLYGYQAAVVSSRALRARASRAREAGSIDYLAEAEEAYNNGLAAAYGWLLGVSPVTPQTSVAAVVNPDTTRAELEAAKAEQAAGQRRFDERRTPDVDVAAHYAGGVASALNQALRRSDLLSFES
jgi:hypothetical protein